MKKQILTLAVCLALTATTTLAATTAPAVNKKTPAKAPQQVAAKSAVKPVATVKPAPVQEQVSPEVQARIRFEAKMNQERELMHNALNLTPEQRTKAKALDQKTREEIKPLFEKVRAEKMKLKELETKKACPIEISKQKHEVRLAKKAIKKHFEASRKKFESILTPDQIAKLKVMREEKRAERAKFMKEHKMHKHCCPGCCDELKVPFGPETHGPKPHGPKSSDSCGCKSGCPVQGCPSPAGDPLEGKK